MLLQDLSSALLAMICFQHAVKQHVKIKRSIKTSESEESNSSDDYYEDCILNSKAHLQIGDYVKVINGLFKGLYATIIDKVMRMN